MANNISLSTIISIFGRVTRQYPRHVAISRVQYNAVVLALYFWSWAMGSVYGVLKGIAVTIFGLVIPDPNYWCSWLGTYLHSNGFIKSYLTISHPRAYSDCHVFLEPV